ncbi:MmpS family transport accessory protein [Amycolatopsis benzoatilytica]|uniref:MmpS family transport accessory protein n=1 Tax=Amycolatopsis benzoatilytica TaxID=346045 RepID=UPI000377E2E8|nr:MmpS family transport accessory protein [Amycolatopsis benzoatilytica]
MGVPGATRSTTARGEPGRLRPLGSVVVVVGVIAVAVTVAWYVMPKTAPGRAAPPAAAPVEPAVVHEITRTVVYELTGDDVAHNLTYVAEGGDLEQQVEVHLPWSATVQRSVPAGQAVFTSLVAQSTGSLACRIRVDGRVVAEKAVAGDGRQLSCTA